MALSRCLEIDSFKRGVDDTQESFYKSNLVGKWFLMRSSSTSVPLEFFNDLLDANLKDLSDRVDRIRGCQV